MRPELQNLIKEIQTVLEGNTDQIRVSLNAILAQGHLLIEDLPGSGKTTLAIALSQTLNLNFNRIQFTSDLLPSDIIGFQKLSKDLSDTEFKKGPLFANLILADELNRGNPKSQSAFLQAMEEMQVSIEGTQLPLPTPFHVIATQNPRQQIGTHPLPESQLDRFLMSLCMQPLSSEAELKLIRGGHLKPKTDLLKQVFSEQQLLKAQREVDQVSISEVSGKYILDLMAKVREQTGYLSTRTGLHIARSAKAESWSQNRSTVWPEDIKFVFPHVIGHRLSKDIGLKEGIAYAAKILAEVAIPI